MRGSDRSTYRVLAVPQAVADELEDLRWSEGFPSLSATIRFVALKGFAALDAAEAASGPLSVKGIPLALTEGHP